MKAFTKSIKKTELLKEIKKHRKADQIIQGTYGKENGQWRGCAVGCSIHSINALRGKDYDTSNHSVYETELGIPKALAHLEDNIFEGLPVDEAVLWPERFTKAIRVGADLSLVIPKFFVWLMRDLEKYTEPRSDQRKALQTVRKLYERKIAGGTIAESEWRAAAYAAYAAYADDDAAAYAAYAAYAAAAYAAYADADAAYADAAAADAAAADAAAAYADAAAKHKYYRKMSNKLIEILEGE